LSMRALSSVVPRLRVTSSECAISAASRIKLRSVRSDSPPNAGTIVLMQVRPMGSDAII
jgi:hypothetical protein